MDEALESVSHVLSSASHHVGFALAPTADAAAFDQIDFVPLGGARLLVVVVEHGGRVINKVIDTGEPIDLRAVAGGGQLPERHFAGLPLADVRNAVTERLAWERSLYDELLARAPAARARRAGRARATSAQSSWRAPARLVEAAAQGIGRERVDVDAAARCCRWSRRSTAWCRILDEYIDRPGAHRRDRRGARFARTFGSSAWSRPPSGTTGAWVRLA